MHDGTTAPADIQFRAGDQYRWFGLSERQQYRLLEIIPGALVWFTLTGSIILSFAAPLAAIVFIIIFDLYWLVRVSYLLVYTIASWVQYRRTAEVDWLARLEADFRAPADDRQGWRDYWHLIFLPTYSEPLAVVRQSFQSLAQVRYPLDRLIIVLAGEERKGEHFRQVSAAIQQEFGQRFGRLLITVHPADLPDEIQGKGANTNYAGHLAQRLIDELGIPYGQVIVSSFDIDTCPHPQYFAYLSYRYLTHPNRTRTSYQPIAIYTNNIWQSPAITRVVASSTTFWLLTDLARPERLFTFSSHSMSFQALVDVGFWQKDIVTEDSRIFLQGFVRYRGGYTVTPLHLHVAMDTVHAGNLWQSLVAQYRQQRRWAWGVENFPYLAWYFWKTDLLPVRKGMHYLWNQVEGVYSWATAPLLILLLGRLPLWLLEPSERTTVLAQQAPQVLELLMNAAMVGLICISIMSTRLLPPHPARSRWYHYPVMLLQWLLFPLCMVLFGSFPATDAQTRLMLGKYLGFSVTEKTRA